VSGGLFLPYLDKLVYDRLKFPSYYLPSMFFSVVDLLFIFHKLVAPPSPPPEVQMRWRFRYNVIGEIYTVQCEYF